MSKGGVILAQIGCGYWGPNLLRNFASLNSCTVRYVVEASRDRRQFVETNYPGIKTLSDVGEALADPEVDAVVIATPASTHYTIARAALSAGKHVLVEKPLAMSVSEVQALSSLAAAGRRALMVGHTFLYNAAVTYLKELITSGQLGKVHYIYAQRLNLGVIRADVNALWNLAPHDVSILCHLLDAAPIAVSAYGNAYIQSGIEDVVFVNLEFPENVRGHIHVSWLDPNKVRRITVVGSKKMVVYDDVADDKIIIYDKGIDRPDRKLDMPYDAMVPGRPVQRVGDIRLPRITFKEPLKVQAEHFVACIAQGTEPLTGAHDGRRVVAVLCAAQESLKHGNSVVRV